MDIGDRMKLYEQMEAGRFLMPNLPALVRIDGRCFHSWTRGLERPFDRKLQELFDEVARLLIIESNAVIGYTQSDEITLLLYNYAQPKSQIRRVHRKDCARCAAERSKSAPSSP